MARLIILSASLLALLVSMVSISNALDFPWTTKNDQRTGLPMNWIERKIKEQIEKLRETMRKGDPASGIPILDPFERDYGEIPINVSIVKATAHVNGLSVIGLSEYSVDLVKVSLANMSAAVRLSWTGIKAKANYKLDGDINIPYAGKAPLYGEGPARGLVYKLWVEGSVRFGVENDDIVTATDLNISWELINPQVRVDGLFGGLELGTTINNIIEDLIPKLEAAYHDDVQKKLEEVALKYINDYLSGMKDDDDEDPYANLLSLALKAAPGPKKGSS